ncbi:hypothetical protein HWV62_30340 [Athelia sp. TMB]|nr:hypothetical protein HWV62_30340 [Athelia sp. TMB]
MSNYQDESRAVDLANLSPLLALLPKDVLGSFLACVNTPAAARSVARFHERASRVRSLHCDESDLDALQSLNLQLLSRPHHTTHILPNLRRLYVSYASPGCGQLLSPWIPSALTAVDIAITVNEDDSAATSILAALEGCTRSLTSFVFTVRHASMRRHPMLRQEMLNILRRMKMLQVARIPLYVHPGDLVDVLMMMPYLQELTLQLLDSPLGNLLHEASDPALWPTSPEDNLDPMEELLHLAPLPIVPFSRTTAPIPHPFPKLRVLHIEGAFTQMVDLFKASRFPVLYLSLRVPAVQSAWEMLAVTQAIADNCPHLLFAKINIERRENLPWIHISSHSTAPCAVFVAGAMFRTANITPEMESAITGRR